MTRDFYMFMDITYIPTSIMYKSVVVRYRNCTFSLMTQSYIDFIYRKEKIEWTITSHCISIMCNSIHRYTVMIIIFHRVILFSIMRLNEHSMLHLFPSAIKVKIEILNSIREGKLLNIFTVQYNTTSDAQRFMQTWLCEIVRTRLCER